MSLDSQVALLPYESSSFATLFRGQNKSLYAYLWYHVAHCLAPIVPPASLGERWWRSHQRGRAHRARGLCRRVVVAAPPQYICCLGGSENRTTGPAARWKCTPIPACGGTSPGGGSLLSASLNANLCRPFYSAARTSPSGGGAVGRRGAFPSRQRRGCMVFPSPARAVCLFSHARRAVIWFY